MKRTATAIWEGSGKEGKGILTTQSNVLNKAGYTHKSRFAEGTGTNPEELIAAAHAGCFAMKLSFNLGGAGFTPTKLDVTCEITLGDGKITKSHLTLKAEVPEIDNEKFQELAEDAKKNCPVSASLNTEISLDAQLV